MRWEEMTSDRLMQAIQDCGGVCIVPLNIIERHGSHLPLGTDLIIGRGIVERIAQAEAAVVFPSYYVGQMNEARHTVGTITYPPMLQLQLLSHTVKEIERQGFTKIVLWEFHGGNAHFLDFFMQSLASEPHDATVYRIGTQAMVKHLEEMFPETVNGHATQMETELVMALTPDLVHMDECDPDGDMDYDRAAHLGSEIMTTVSWYARFPQHQSGTAHGSQVEHGKKILDEAITFGIELLRKIKQDKATMQLQKEFFSACEKAVQTRFSSSE